MKLFAHREFRSWALRWTCAALCGLTPCFALAEEGLSSEKWGQLCTQLATDHRVIEFLYEPNPQMEQAIHNGPDQDFGAALKILRRENTVLFDVIKFVEGAGTFYGTSVNGKRCGMGLHIFEDWTYLIGVWIEDEFKLGAVYTADQTNGDEYISYAAWTDMQMDMRADLYPKMLRPYVENMNIVLIKQNSSHLIGHFENGLIHDEQGFFCEKTSLESDVAFFGSFKSGDRSGIVQSYGGSIAHTGRWEQDMLSASIGIGSGSDQYFMLTRKEGAIPSQPIASQYNKVNLDYCDDTQNPRQCLIFNAETAGVDIQFNKDGSYTFDLGLNDDWLDTKISCKDILLESLELYNVGYWERSYQQLFQKIDAEIPDIPTPLIHNKERID